MAKVIKVTDELREEIRKEFEEQLAKSKFPDGKFTFSKSFSTVQRKVTLKFSEKAWWKMRALVAECDKEVGWHGFARRGEDPEKDEYYIDDIIVYPQEVSGTTVTTDQVKYQTWLYNRDDEEFFSIRMQGHSHVNMGVTPSGVDLTLYESILANLGAEDFYIFLIWNKKDDRTIKIYDLAKNILFENADVSVVVEYHEGGIEEFLEQAKAQIEEKKTPVVPVYQSGRTYPQTNNTKPDFAGASKWGSYEDEFDTYYKGCTRGW